MNNLRRNKNRIGWLLILSILVILINHKLIEYQTTDLIFSDYTKIPQTEFALFLGTPKYLPNGDTNNYYKNRINSITRLYTNGIIRKIIISADTLNKYRENEVDLIKLDLIENGVQETDLILDTYGNRTWNSVINLEKISTKNAFIIVSQRFHLERALYIARKKDINAIGFKAKGSMSTKLWIREVLARVKMQIDILFNGTI
ncbi:ElyC/SanA/YdcF family protein [Aquimarina addita]|uniref:ElyC/SanA/YdcF family protein n=1 Tax=Aquimarina addita TaxID=870485 RepID=A0ABP6UN71_9FLAO